MPEGAVMGKVANMKGGKKVGGGIKNENMYAQHWRAQHCKKSRGKMSRCNRMRKEPWQDFFLEKLSEPWEDFF